MQNGAASLENSPKAPQKVKHRIITGPNNSTPIYPKGWKKDVYTKTYTRMLIAAFFIIAKSGNNPNIHGCWMDKQNVGHPYNGILFSYKKEWSTDLCYNMDEPWKHAEWKKPITKGNLFYDSIYGKSIDTESRLVVALGWERWGIRGNRQKVLGFFAGRIGMF